jgi:hypothetical protein
LRSSNASPEFLPAFCLPCSMRGPVDEAYSLHPRTSALMLHELLRL